MSNAYDPFSPPPIQKQNTGLIIAIVLSVVAIPVLLVCAGIALGLLLPAVQAGRESARRMQCSNNLKQIALALLNYETQFHSLPPAYTTDESGRRLHSWRTLVLPYLEQRALYDSIDLSKPWDDPVNQTAAATVVPVYACPTAGPVSVATVYQVIVDPSSAFPGATPTKLASIRDGFSNTVAVTETSVTNAVPWMSPQDSDMQEFISPGKTHHVGGSSCAMVDGASHFLSSSLDATTRRSLVTRSGGEMIPRL